MRSCPESWRPAILLLISLLVSVLATASTAAESTPPAAGIEGQELKSGAMLSSTGVPALQGPIDADTYIVGPGDSFSITVWGQGVANHLAVVTPEGELVIPGVAMVQAAGRTLRTVKGDVTDALADHYHDVEVSVSLVGLRSMLVNVLGRVAAPGTYVGTPLDLTGELIRKAGGFAEGASRRNIVVTRRSGETRRVDLVRYHATGDVTSNPPILDGDVIFVPFAVQYVHVDGAVGAPGRYERAPGETVGSLIQLAGGFARGAVTDSVEVRRFINGVETTSDLVRALEPQGSGVQLADGDQVYVREINEWRRITSVEVEGEVQHPGPYGISEGVDRLSDVIRAAGGPTDEASLRDARLVRALPWGGPDLEFERLKQIPVSEMTDMEYDYVRTRLRDRSAVVADFEKALAGDPAENVLLLGGDRIVIPKLTRTVEVIGQVSTPGEVAHVPGKSYRYYVREAGGYSSAARKGRIRVIRGATGESVYAGRAGELAPGDVVWVPERQDTDWWSVAREIASFLTSIATVYIVVDQVTAR